MKHQNIQNNQQPYQHQQQNKGNQIIHNQQYKYVNQQQLMKQRDISPYALQNKNPGIDKYQIIQPSQQQRPIQLQQQQQRPKQIQRQYSDNIKYTDLQKENKFQQPFRQDKSPINAPQQPIQRIVVEQPKQMPNRIDKTPINELQQPFQKQVIQKPLSQQLISDRSPINHIQRPLQRQGVENPNYIPHRQDKSPINHLQQPYKNQVVEKPNSQPQRQDKTPINEIQQPVQKQIVEQPNYPKFFSEEINQILKEIGELSDIERDNFMRLFGKYEYGINGKNLDDLKKRYPEIYYLVKASKSLEKTRKLKPRSVQIVSCIMFLFKQKPKGRILQINTGEGKSITVALMAATKGQMKEKVDIFTSNKELAKRDCEEFEEFYKELGLTCGSIGSEEIRSSEPNEAYKKDVVYGDVGSYAADLLGEYYEQRGTRCGRLFENAIVDEVDCMFIDQHNHSTSLAKSIPGLSKMNTILWLIWYKITQMRDNFLKGYYYFVEKGDKQYYCFAEDFIAEFINQILMQGLVSEEIDKQIPSHMKAFAMSQMKEWIRNGFHALNLQKNKEYKVENDKIIPIDYDNTGVAQNNTQWRGGLHQFIQMKENVTVTPMNMTVNFVSNIYMFLLYKSNLIGLTGTLGTTKSIRVLEEFYTIDALKVPPFKPRKLQILEPIIEKNTSDFQVTIVNEITKKIQEGRPCLFICEFEKFGKNLTKLVQKKFPNIKTVEYYSGDESIEKEQLNEFCIIISTNLAGRGTDIKLSQKIIDQGGLHVIVTFTPKNKRVEDQAFGRAGRQGQYGSAQMIIDGSKDSFILRNKIQGNLIEERDKVDNYICDRQLQNMKDISKMDEVFWDYCKSLNTCEQLKNKQYMRKQEEEIWATFYCKIQNLRKEPEKVKKEYAQFKEEFQKRITENKIVNPTYLINEGIKLLMDKKYDEALKISDEILNKNNDNLPAHYIKAIAYVSLKKHAKSLQMLDRCEELLMKKNDLHQSLQIIQLQSQSLIQQEYSQELLEQSCVLSQQFRKELFESKIFQQEVKYNRKQLEECITDSGCFKRIKDEEVIRGKMFEQIRDLKSDIKELSRNTSKRENIQFISMNEYFQDDKITEQILKEHQNEELPYIVEVNDRKPLQWKSLIPLACSVFQLANSLYLLQAQQDSQSENPNTPLTRAINQHIKEQGFSEIQGALEQNYPEKIEQQDKQIEGIAYAIKKIVSIEGFSLKEYLSKNSLMLIENIRRFKTQEYSHMLIQISASSADRVQVELMRQIQFKNAFTKEIMKYSPEISYITQQMAKDQTFQKLRELSSRFQDNCKKILESSEIIPFTQNDKLESIYKNFKRQFPYLNFQQFQKDIIGSLIQHILKNNKKIVIENLENFIKENYELQFSAFSFMDLVSNLISDPISKSIDFISGDIQKIVIDSLRQQILAQFKQIIKQLKDQIRNVAQSKEQQGYIQQKQVQYLENKLKNHQKFYAFIQEDKEMLQQYPQYINQALQQLKMLDKNNNLCQYSESHLKSELKYLILKNNKKEIQFEEFIDIISSFITKMFVLNNNNGFNFNDFQQQIFKKIQMKLLTPAFKIVSHVFQQQIESNAIYGLFKHIIQ